MSEISVQCSLVYWLMHFYKLVSVTSDGGSDAGPGCSATAGGSPGASAQRRPAATGRPQDPGDHRQGQRPAVRNPTTFIRLRFYLNCLGSFLLPLAGALVMDQKCTVKDVHVYDKWLSPIWKDPQVKLLPCLIHISIQSWHTFGHLVGFVILGNWGQFFPI